MAGTQSHSIGSNLSAAIPNQKTLIWLFAGGFAGLMVWEIWARVITAWILGGPLEPSGLVTSLGLRWTGYEIPKLGAEAIHYVIGIIGYPIAYFVISRVLKAWGIILDVGVWLAFTAYLAYRFSQHELSTGMIVFWAIVSAVTATRMFNPNALLANCLSWGSFTWFNALGLMAPLAGLPFLLIDWGGGLSFMSYVGHAIYGFIAALVFELKAGRQGLPEL